MFGRLSEVTIFVLIVLGVVFVLAIMLIANH